MAKAGYFLARFPRLKPWVSIFEAQKKEVFILYLISRAAPNGQRFGLVILKPKEKASIRNIISKAAPNGQSLGLVILKQKERSIYC